MKTMRLILFALGVCAAANAAQPTYAMLSSSKQVRKMSFAGDILFKDMLSGIGGAGFADTVRFPQAKTRTVTRIDVIVPYDNIRTGIERWTITHDGNQLTAYILYFVTNGRGGTNFRVKMDDGKT